MLIKCKYCGKEIEDNNTVCPFCGSDLKEEIKKFKGTPRTIEELKAWYKAKNLPPYEVTRFFIGQDHVGPRAFGIYEENGNFIVYKNKADGSRAIRYEGTDEKRAVNELYLKLKAEISNQKKNINRKKQEKTLKILVLSFFAFVASIFIIAGISIHKSNVEYERKPHNDYYWYENTMYYCENSYNNSYDWWKYSDSKQDYYLYQTLKYDKKHIEDSFPDGINNDNCIHDLLPRTIYYKLYPKGTQDEKFKRKYDIYRSHAYIDAGHHYPPYNNGYYVLDDDVYYYLDNDYTYYGNYNDGWYYYDNGVWIYYADPYDYATLGDYFWYTPYDYYVGETIDDYYTGAYDGYENNNEWVVDNSVSDFEDTSYYSDYEYAHEEYEKEAAEREESSYWEDTDNDYDWDSSDSWDSSSTDWDSDW